MSSNLTWADVAHYYAKNDPFPKVWIPDAQGDYYMCPPIEYQETVMGTHWMDFNLPVLRELNEITEEDARDVIVIAGIQIYNLPLSAKEILLTEMRGGAVSDSENVLELLTGNPKVWHYLISKNYNVFGIKTYKEDNP